MLKSLRRYHKLRDRWNHMPLDFGLLAGETFPGPFAHVVPNIRPYKFVTDSFACAFYTWMSEAMDHIKYSSSEGKN